MLMIACSGMALVLAWGQPCWSDYGSLQVNTMPYHYKEHNSFIN